LISKIKDYQKSKIFSLLFSSLLIALIRFASQSDKKRSKEAKKQSEERSGRIEVVIKDYNQE
jgi:membrane protein implicated in regulation of membrane protease activity